MHVILERPTYTGECEWRSPEAAAEPEMAGVSEASAGFDRVELESFLTNRKRSGEMLEGHGIGLVAHEFNRAIGERPRLPGEATNEPVAFVSHDVVGCVGETIAEVGKHLVGWERELDLVGSKRDRWADGESAERAGSDNGCRADVIHNLA